MIKIKPYSTQEMVDEISKVYEVTRDGLVINRSPQSPLHFQGNTLKFPLDYKGYPKTRLWCPTLSKNKDHRLPFRLHKLVAMFHLKNYDPLLEVNHKNGIKTDNRIENLEMVTASENAQHAWNVLDSKKRRDAVAKRMRGRIVSQETREKISKTKKGI